MKYNINNSIKHFKKELKKSLKPLFLLVYMLVFSFPQVSISQDFNRTIIGPMPKESIKAYYNGPTLPEIPLRPADRIMYIMVSAYNSEVGQTDDTPFITAFNTHVRDGIVATNFLPKGTVIRFPDYSEDKEFVVEDRMNKRYYYQMDIWMEHRVDAVNFGSQFLKMEIL
ncbi:MAG: 3D domain-containing protein [Candidatus Scalindua sp.]|jgi:3D (Asp-Asp-Asp) domain-containing protein|nr:3D domain-containing protein [Candidatus Scalindua sp.]